MAVRGTDRQLQRAWRSKPPRGRRVAQGGVAIVIAAVVGVSAALAVRSCSGDDAAPESTMPPLTMVFNVTTTTVPPTTTTLVVYYEVQPGDSLFAIAQRFETDLRALIDLNNITNPDRIEAGQKLKIPPATVLVTAPLTTTTSEAPVSTGG
jgi:LysM repeat protein